MHFNTTRVTGSLHRLWPWLALLMLTVIIPVHPQNIVVDDLQFHGNEEISGGQIRGAILTRENPWYNFFLFWKDPKLFSEDVFLNDLLRIEKFYHNEGYLDAIVQDYQLDFDRDNASVEITISIEEGKPTIVRNASFTDSAGTGLPFERSFLQEKIILDQGEPYREEDLRTDYHTLINTFSNNGYPYIEARVKPRIDDKKNTADLLWIFRPGAPSEFGPISVTGNESVSADVIRRGLDFREGEPFSQHKLEFAQSQIYRLELFQYVNLKATNLRQRPTCIPIKLEVRERELNSLELGSGYGTEEAFRIRGDWTHRNFFGGARILRAEIKHSTKILPLNATLEFSQPFFLDDQNDLYIKPFYTWQDEKSFEARRLGFETTLNRRLNPGTNIFITNRFSRDTVRVKYEDDAERLDDFYNKSILLGGLRRNTTDQLFTPTRGVITNFTLEEAGLLFQSKFRYYKITGEYRIYHELAPRWIVAARILAGTMNTFGGSETTPVEERFFAGGSYSVRGWERQELGPQRTDSKSGKRIPIGGNSMLEGGLELRFPVYKNLGGALLLDYGDVWEEWDGFDPGTLKYAVGIGIRYNTPIGPLRLDVAWKLNKQYTAEDDYKIHISIGHAF